MCQEEEKKSRSDSPVNDGSSLDQFDIMQPQGVYQPQNSKFQSMSSSEK